MFSLIVSLQTHIKTNEMNQNLNFAGTSVFLRSNINRRIVKKIFVGNGKNTKRTTKRWNLANEGIRGDNLPPTGHMI